MASNPTSTKQSPNTQPQKNAVKPVDDPVASKSCRDGVRASINFAQRIAIILYMEKDDLSKGLE